MGSIRLAKEGEAMLPERLRKWACATGVLAALIIGAAAAPAVRGRAEPAGGPTLVHLAPGSSVKEGAPKGWTMRVIRSVPRLASGDLATLPESAAATATLFRTIMTAQVVARGTSHELARIGLGIAVPVGDRELVVTPEGPEDALATLGFVDRVVLKEAEAELAKGRVVARTPTFALFRTPSVQLVKGRHVPVDLSYALLVDPGTGALTTLAWTVPSANPAAAFDIIELPQGLSFVDDLDVKVTKWLGPVPLSWSFAMASPFPGRRIAVPAPIARLIADPRADPAAKARALSDLARSGRR